MPLGMASAKPDLLQHIEHCLVDALQVGVRHDLVVAAAHARPDRPFIHGQRGGAQRPARLPPAAAGEFGLNDTHWMALAQNSDRS